MNQIKPSLFGIRKSNRDFTLKETWGKNQFNSSFPVSLCCYLDSKNIDAINLCIQEKKFCQYVFIWSNAGFTYFISTIANREISANSINRQRRTAIWLYKMLQDFKNHQRFNHKKIIDNLSYNTKNDKAFASSGNITNKYMMCDRLTKPMIKKNEIKNIILGGGQNLLSPERRFDAIVFNSPDLFR